jgi:hypothetical protein
MVLGALVDAAEGWIDGYALGNAALALRLGPGDMNRALANLKAQGLVRTQRYGGGDRGGGSVCWWRATESGKRWVQVHDAARDEVVR